MDLTAGLVVLGDGGTPQVPPPQRMVPLRLTPARAEPSLRVSLRTATQDVHNRLHHHAGFAAIKDATIDLADYQAIIARLYGFYVPFEAAAAISPDRSTWLADDLQALGWERPLQTLPQCPHIPGLAGRHARLGALYVAEGSALGGRELARSLDPLLGRGTTRGRQFLIGRGAGTGLAWGSYLAQLSAASSDPAACAEIVEGAVATFAAFENWLNGWKTPTHG